MDLGTLARNQQIPELYLSKLVAPMKAAGFIRAERGAKGGYVLAKRPEEVGLLAVVEALEGRTSLLDCLGDPAACARAGECATLPVWRGLETVIKDYLRGITLADAAGTTPDYSI